MRMIGSWMLALLTFAGGIKTAGGQQSAALPQWAPVAALLPKLGGAISVEGFLLRPPQGYGLVIPNSGVPEGVSSFAWVGPGRKDNTHPVLMLNIVVPPNSDLKNAAVSDVAISLLKGVKARRAGWKQTPTEAGTIQGLKFVRICWSGVDKKENRKMQGWILVGRDGDTFIQLSSQDVAPFAENALSLAETAARTFKRLDPRIFYAEQWPSHAQIFAVNPDGSGRVCLTPTSDTDYAPALCPDGSALAFTSHRDGVRSIYLMNLDGTNQRRITLKDDAGLCAWSPDGSELAFSSNRNGRYCIYVMNRDGSEPRQLTDGPSDDLPSWSPDGRSIAYEGRSDKNWRIYVVQADGKGAKALTRGTWDDRYPQWSPDSTLIAFTSYQNGKGALYLMKADGTSQTRLSVHAAEDREPFWTADGASLLFHSNRAGSFNLYTIDLLTRAERRLTTGTRDTAQAATLGRSHPGPVH